MTSRRHIAKVLFLGAPLLAGLISEFFMYLADSAMVGRLGTEYLAAIGIAVVFGEILWVVVWPLAPATQAITSRRYGRQEALDDADPGEYQAHVRRTGVVLNHSILLALAAGVSAIVLAGFCKELLGLILDDAPLISRVDAYIGVLKWVMPLAGVFYALYGFLAAIH
ncbi:MAG: hypothetical protein GY859_08615, partial [Desulfobacterales bacterium]|nr:hypothetical protein [Desulfobacterales bacterium]